MPYCKRCAADLPDGTVYCTQCGYRVEDTQRPPRETTPESGIKGGQTAVQAAAPPMVRRRALLGPMNAWRSMVTGAKVVVWGAIFILGGFFVPVTRDTPIGTATLSLASVGGEFLLIPFLCLAVVFLMYWSGVERAARSRILMYAMAACVGAFVLAIAMYGWRNGLSGMLLLFGSAAVIGGAYGAISDQSRFLTRDQRGGVSV